MPPSDKSGNPKFEVLKLSDTEVFIGRRMTLAEMEQKRSRAQRRISQSARKQRSVESWDEKISAAKEAGIVAEAVAEAAPAEAK